MRSRRSAKEQRTDDSTSSSVLSPQSSVLQFKRTYRWLNLTLVHHGLWPLILLLTTAAPGGAPWALPLDWFLIRLAGPALAATLALIYLAQRPLIPVATAYPAVPEQEGGARARVRSHALFLLLGLPVMVALARLVAGPVESTSKLLVYGLADVAAFQLIHFGVVGRSYGQATQGRAAAVLLFAVSWAIRDALLMSFGPASGSVGLALTSGLALGLTVAALSAALRGWPGGFLPAAAVHWLVVYLIFGFAG